MKRSCPAAWIGAVLLLAVAALPAQAAVITYTTPSGATQGGEPVSATATFTTGLNSLSISLSNLFANPTSVIQNISDLDFVISTGQTTVGTGGGLTSSSATERTVGKAGKGSEPNNPYTDGKAPVPTGWGLSENFPLPFSAGTGFTLCIICPSGGTVVVAQSGQPAHTLIGPPDGSNFYSNANGSIAGNGPHNPFLIGPVTFDLTIQGLTSLSTISAVVFSFGTTTGSNTQGCVEGQCTTQVPSIPPLTLVGLGLVAAGAGGAIRRWVRRT